jgi:hypothetical protein
MKFKINDTVKAEISAQGMIKGNIYTITNVVSDYTPFGTFVTYSVTSKERFHSGQKDLVIGNGHLLLSKVSA